MAIPINLELEKIINSQFNSIGNLSLLLTRYVREWEPNWKFESKQQGQHMSNAIKATLDKSGYISFFNRWSTMLDSIGAVRIKGKVLWRLVVGLGTGSVLETSMTLHHIFGVPYIPGSALKGVVRTCYIKRNYKKIHKEWNEKDSKCQNDKRKHKTIDAYLEANDTEFLTIFGGEGRKGRVTFLDSYPALFPKLEMDIMNPHFQEYYSEGKNPADWLSPVPVKFVTVAGGCEFVFPFITEDPELQKNIESLINEALTDSGIGAKTAVGYGYFSDLSTVAGKPKTDAQPSKETPTSQNKTICEQTYKTSEEREKPLPAVHAEPLARYQKNSTELKDDFLKPDGSMKSMEEYQKYIELQGKQFKKDDKQLYEKAKKFYEKSKSR